MGLIADDLKIAKEKVYDTCGLILADLNVNAESQEYSACSFLLNGFRVVYRASKITPTKTGQFVTIWKRNTEGITVPFDLSDGIDFIIVSSRSGDNLGQFIFPVNVLANHGVVTRNGKEGKRGIRVYPPWDMVPNRQAEKTQQWQRSCFLHITGDNTFDPDLVQKLFAV